MDLSMLDEPGPVTASELRHRMANLFQLLATTARMRIQRCPDAEAQRKLTWLLEAVGVIGVLQHRLLSPDGENAALFLEEMLPQWRRRCTGSGIAIELDAEPIQVREQSLSALALMAHELVSNAFAHAFPDGRTGTVRIGLQRLDGASAVFSVADDGCGYDPQAAPTDTLGLWLLKGLAGQVRGRMTTDAGPAGVAVRVEFQTPSA
jgi:two-component sensor histidine kinase